MDRSGQIGTDRNVLMRIAALLLSLADLAERAAGLPFLRRRHVLGILGFGEAEARAFLIEISTGAPASADAPAGDAALLAARLRALALLLCVVQARAAFPGAAAARAVRRPREMSGPAVRRPDARALPAPDTS